MASFYADENAVLRLSPNLNFDLNPQISTKRVGDDSTSSASLIMSPDDRQFLNSTGSASDDGHLISTRKSERKIEEPTSSDRASSEFSFKSSPASAIEMTAERQRRETQESEQLAWEMMREESISAYRMQLDFINSISNTMSADDLEAIQMAMRDGDAFNTDEVIEADRDDGEEDDQNQGENQDSDVDAWDYDRLLALEDIMGDVKTERWRLKSKQVIKKLPQILYSEMQLRHQSSLKNDTVSDSSSKKESCSPLQKKVRVMHDPSCAVCMEVFTGSDQLCVLPCQHYFHVVCTEGWLADHNTCPMCKSAISSTP